MPYRKVKQLFDVFFDMPFVPASAMAFDRTATRKGLPLYEDLKQKVRNAASARADETSWRQDGIGHYLWYAGNDQLALYLIDRHRSSKVVEEILGDEFAGILNTDDNAETLRTRLRDPTRLYHRLFTFLKYPWIEPTNNQAEQSLRYMVIFRKICFGTRCSPGSLSHSVLPSLLMTARRQGQHQLTFFKTLFTSATATAQAALYNGHSH